jgi:hypothetical protein
MPKQQIFEGVSDDEDKVVLDVVEEVKKPEKPAKKQRAPLSDERKAQLREQLKKGRETSLAKRQKNALVKKATKVEKDKEDDIKIAKHILGKDTDEIQKLKNEIADLKRPKAPAAVKEPTPVKEPAPVRRMVPAPVKVIPPPAPPAPKVFDTRDTRKRRKF